MSDQLGRAEQTKFALFFGGIEITSEAEAFVMRPFGERPLTLADYASTSGVSLALEGDVWVNAPIAAFNPNFVFEPRHQLRVEGEQLFVADKCKGYEIAAQFVPVPAYHNERNAEGELFTNYVHTHTDRARISPIQGCSMRCRFCDIPYEFKGRYMPKAVERLIEAAARAIADPIQPASHLLISGGTPAPRDHDYLKHLYRSVITAFPGTEVDIMMVPLPGVLDLDDLIDAGVRELSLNIEIWDRDIARQLMPEKFAQGLPFYLDFIAEAVDRLGPGRVRSILMVGLEPAERTLEAVEALASVGCLPVLSPFRPDPITDLATLPPPSEEFMTQVFLEARERAARYSLKLGPGCIPCSHNTMTLADGSDDYHYHEHRPRLL